MDNMQELSTILKTTFITYEMLKIIRSSIRSVTQTRSDDFNGNFPVITNFTILHIIQNIIAQVDRHKLYATKKDSQTSYKSDK